MASAPIIHIVCSDRHRNGKTLLARVLVDYLMLDGRDPFVVDADYPEGPLRAYFPGRTALVDFDRIRGRMRVFDTILASRGRDYVIDIPAPRSADFFQAVLELGFFAEARKVGFQIVILFIVDRDEASPIAAERLNDVVKPDLMIFVRNEAIGSALAELTGKFVIDMPALDLELVEAISNRRVSLRSYLLGDEARIPQAYRIALKSFLYVMMTAFREIEPALSLRKLRR